MPTIYIRNPETSLAVDSSYYTLRSKGRRICRIPPTMVEQVIVEHGVEITRTALDRLGSTGVPVTFLGREGHVQARLVAAWKPDPRPRLAQAAAWFDPALRLQLARRWVDAKLANAFTVIRRHISNYSDPELSRIANVLRDFRDRLPSASDHSMLMGMEGAAARVYFEAVGRMLRASWISFSGRNRRPPRDPANALLSYAYAVISHQLLACAEAVGLDPYVGYLHTNEVRRPTLVLDLMEPFRPVLGDRLMLRLLNLGTLQAEHFEEPQGAGNGMRITREGRHLLLQIFNDWLMECDDTLGEQMPAPGSLLLRETERFASLATSNDLKSFRPYYLDQQEIRD